MTQNKVALKNMTEEELKEFLKSIGEKPFRGTQIFSWIYKGAKTFDDMNNIPKSLREKLEKVSYIGNIKQELVLESKVDKCKKYLFQKSRMIINLMYQKSIRLLEECLKNPFKMMS